MRAWIIAVTLGLTCLGAASLNAQGYSVDLAPTTYNLFGTPGLIDTPTARSAPDGEIAATLSALPGTTRGTLTFQITPRLSGTFRYTKFTDIVSGPLFEFVFDRSFDLRFRVVDEGYWRPAVAIGVNDFVGTGFYSGEYVVASKRLTPRLEGSIGIGWGRFAGRDTFSNPLGVFSDAFKNRPDRTFDTGGELELERFFRGDTALFGGLSYKATDDVTLKVEYSSDDYDNETGGGNFTRRSPFNFGVDWSVRPGVRAQLAYLHGDTLAAGLTFAVNPRRPVVNGGRDPAPQAVLVRVPGDVSNQNWTRQTDAEPILRGNLRDALANDGLVLEALRIEPTRTRILVRSLRYRATAQAIGRTARVASRTLPASIETFEIVPVVNGLPTVSVTLQRSDLEELENDADASWRSYIRARIESGHDAREGTIPDDGLYPRYVWSVSPYIETALFDPASPLRADLGVQFDARVDLAPGLSFAGTYRQRAIGNRDEADQPSNSVLPRVRSESFLYGRESGALNTLYANYQWRPAENFWARVTGGYLERQFAGVSTELLWKPAASRLALGVEINYARQRDFEGFGLQDYDVVTGHATAYYRFANGFDAHLSVGRYLAGDVGGTLSVERTFANGWRVGAFATLTDVSFEEFGEGSFDKGIVLTIPLEHFVGQSVGQTRGIAVRPVLRDGGAFLAVPNRLYGQVFNDSNPALQRSWGTFWR